MQFWFAHASEVTIREQLVTQIILGILSGDLSPGQRLPSTRELARRFHLHANTVSAGYRHLERERWVEFRHGSGVYVRDVQPEIPSTSTLALDSLIQNFFRSARALGAALPDVRARLQQRLELQPPDHFLVIEPDEELRRIVIAEIEDAVRRPVKGCDFEECRRPDLLIGAIPLVLPSKAKKVRQLLPPATELITLQIGSVPASLAAHLPAQSNALIGLASRWPDFLKLARTMLVASGFDSECLVDCDARKPNWQRGLRPLAAVICDSVTAATLPAQIRVARFNLLANSTMADLQQY